jgi:hypothetical protein
MIFENFDGKPVEVNQKTFEYILKGTQDGLTPVKLRLDNTEYWLKATEKEIMEASLKD